MSEQAARSWLSSHRDIVPALEIHHRQASKILEDHTRTVADLAAVVALDPGMSLTLFDQVNSKLHQGGRPPVGSVQVALGLLGDSAIADLVLEHRVLDRIQTKIAKEITRSIMETHRDDWWLNNLVDSDTRND